MLSVLLMEFSVLLRGKGGAGFKHAGEVYRGGKAGLLCNIRYSVIGFFKQILGGHYANGIDIFHNAQTRDLFEKAGEIGRTQIESRRDVGETQLLIVMCRNVAFYIGYGFVVDIFVILQGGILLADEPVYIKQQLAYKAAAHHLGIGRSRVALIVYSAEYVFYQRAHTHRRGNYMYSALEAGEQVNTLVSVEGGEKLLREIHDGAGVPLVSYGTGFMYLVGIYQNDVSRVDEIGAVIYKISA